MKLKTTGWRTLAGVCDLLRADVVRAWRDRLTTGKIGANAEHQRIERRRCRMFQLAVLCRLAKKAESAEDAR